LKLKLLNLFLISILFVACGYKPTASYANKSIMGLTYVNVKIDIDNANNTVLIKDALVELLIGKFDVKITNIKAIANSFVKATLVSVEEKQLQANNLGFAKVYRETVTLKISYNKRDEKSKEFVLSNYYDFTVDFDSIVTQSKKDEAIKVAISKALSDIFSNIAVNYFK
jgi:hypothetical protein